MNYSKNSDDGGKKITPEIKAQSGLVSTFKDCSHIKCFNYNKMGHYATTCLQPKKI